MKHRNVELGIGIGFAALAGLIFALNATALPAVVDVPFVTMAVASVAAAVLAVGVTREVGRSDRVRWRLWMGAIALAGTLGLVAQSAQRRFLSYRSREVTFSNENVTLAGTLYVPRAGTRHPAVVFIHGSGPETRKEYAFFATLFARHGFTALAYDKRGTGLSNGKLYDAHYGEYAGDALSAVRYLAGRSDVDARCIGLIGFSEGEWVAPLAATRSNEIAFLIVVAPSGVSPAQQVNEEIALRLQAHGYGAADVARALALNERVFEYQRTGEPSPELSNELRQSSNEPWFRDARDIPTELYPANEYRWWRSVMDFAPGPMWEQVKVPVLLIKGGKDPNSTALIARQEIEAALARASHVSADFVLFPEGDHAMLRWPLGAGVPPPVFAEGYLDTMTRWAADHCSVAH